MSKKRISSIHDSYWDTLFLTKHVCDVVNDAQLDGVLSRFDPVSAHMELVAEAMTRRNNNTLGPHATKMWQTFEHDDPWRGAEEWRSLSTSLLRMK
jgi:hypothetical protein